MTVLGTLDQPLCQSFDFVSSFHQHPQKSTDNFQSTSKRERKIDHRSKMSVQFDFAPKRPENIEQILNGLDRYNPETTGIFQDYVQQQCEEGTYDCYANLALLKLYVPIDHSDSRNWAPIFMMIILLNVSYYLICSCPFLKAPVLRSCVGFYWVDERKWDAHDATLLALSEIYILYSSCLFFKVKSKHFRLTFYTHGFFRGLAIVINSTHRSHATRPSPTSS